MWRTVEARQRPSRRRCESSAATASAIAESTTVASPQSPAALARDIRRAAAALRTADFVKRDLFAPLQEFVTSADAPSSVRIIALGIGPFARDESRSGFLQMALFIALRESLSSAVPLSAAFFDPAAGERHLQCCARLAVEAESENSYGAYTPLDERGLLVAFLPHAPWALLRNIFAANIAAGSLSRLLIIGNDVCGAHLPRGDFAAALAPYLHISAVDAGFGTRNANDEESGDEVRLRGVSGYDVHRAFSDTAVMRLNSLHATEVAKLRLPPIVKSGMDIQ